MVPDYINTNLDFRFPSATVAYAPEDGEQSGLDEPTSGGINRENNRNSACGRPGKTVGTIKVATKGKSRLGVRRDNQENDR